MGVEDLKVKAFTDDLSMMQMELDTEKVKKSKLVEESEKLEKRVATFTAERKINLEKMFKQDLDELLLNQKKNIMSTISKVSESTDSTKKSGSTVFFSLKDLHGSVSSSEQLPKVKEILENKTRQILEIIDKVESKEGAKEVVECLTIRFYRKIKIQFNTLTHSDRSLFSIIGL